MNSASSVQRFIRVIELLTWHGRGAWIMDVLSWQQTQQKLTVETASWTCRLWASSGSYGHPDHGRLVVERGA
jgi:hypothetical protein